MGMKGRGVGGAQRQQIYRGLRVWVEGDITTLPETVDETKSPRCLVRRSVG